MHFVECRSPINYSIPILLGFWSTFSDTRNIKALLVCILLYYQFKFYLLKLNHTLQEKRVLEGSL